MHIVSDVNIDRLNGSGRWLHNSSKTQCMYVCFHSPITHTHTHERTISRKQLNSKQSFMYHTMTILEVIIA